MNTKGFARIIYGILALLGVILVGGMIYASLQLVLLPQPQETTDAYLGQVQAGDWAGAQQSHIAQDGFQQAQADWQALFSEKGSLDGWQVHSFDMLYGISFSSQGIGGTSVTAVYNLEFEDDLAQVTLELLPDWQSWKISNINIRY